jgi:hypothetical protein
MPGLAYNIYRLLLYLRHDHFLEVVNRARWVPIKRVGPSGSPSLLEHVSNRLLYPLMEVAGFVITCYSLLPLTLAYQC